MEKNLFKTFILSALAVLVALSGFSFATAPVAAQEPGDFAPVVDGPSAPVFWPVPSGVQIDGLQESQHWANTRPVYCVDQEYWNYPASALKNNERTRTLRPAAYQFLQSPYAYFPDLHPDYLTEAAWTSFGKSTLQAVCSRADIQGTYSADGGKYGTCKVNNVEIPFSVAANSVDFSTADFQIATDTGVHLYAGDFTLADLTTETKNKIVELSLGDAAEFRADVIIGAANFLGGKVAQYYAADGHTGTILSEPYIGPKTVKEASFKLPYPVTSTGEITIQLTDPSYEIAQGASNASTEIQSKNIATLGEDVTSIFPAESGLNNVVIQESLSFADDTTNGYKVISTINSFKANVTNVEQYNAWARTFVDSSTDYEATSVALTNYIYADAYNTFNYNATIPDKGYAQIVYYASPTVFNTAFKFAFQVSEKPTFQIKKVDNSNQATLQNAVFEITFPNSTKEDRTTDENGLITLSELENGTYAYQEKTPPKGYAISDKTAHNFYVVNGQIYSDQAGTQPLSSPVQVSDKKLEVVIKKADFTTAEGIPGAVISIYNNQECAGEPVDTKTSDGNGNTTFDGSKFEVGKTYWFKEVTPPKGYGAVTTIFDFTIDTDGHITSQALPNLTITDKPISVIIKKVDITGKGLAGATLEVSGPGITTFQAETNTAGLLEIPDGVEFTAGQTYNVREIAAPEGFLKSPASESFIIDETGSGQAEFTNNRNTVTIKKVSNANTPIAGTEFRLINPGMGIPITKNALGETLNLVTNANGEITLTALASGTYELSEITPTDGYYIDPETTIRTLVVDATTHAITIQGGASQAVVTNKPTTVLLKKTVKGSTTPVANVTIELYRGGQKVTTNAFGQTLNLTTDTNGEIKLEGLKAGTYQYKEVSAPDQYIIDTTNHSFTIPTTGTECTGDLTFSNTLTHVVIHKSDLASGKAVKDAKIVISDSTGTAVFTGISDENGLLSQIDGSGKVIPGSGIPDGLLKRGQTYTFKETVAPAGYIINETTFHFTIAQDGKVTSPELGENLTVTNSKARVIIYKGDSINKTKGVRGALIELRDSSNNIVTSYTDTYYTNAEGKVILSGLPAGNYTFKEIVAPAGYLLNTETYKFTVNNDGTTSVGGKVVSTVDFFDTPTTVTITKTNARTKAAVQGASYVVYRDGKTVGTYTTNAKGQFTIENVEAGKYTYKETKAPAGYSLDTTTYSFTVYADGKKEGTFNVTDNELGITIYKKDYTTGKALSGATFEIRNGTKVVATVTTDANGIANIQALEPGTYDIVETIAPQGYVVTDKKYRFTIKTNGSVDGDVTVYNKLSGDQPTPTPGPNNKPNTGDAGNPIPFIAISGASLIAIAYICSKKRKIME